MRWTGFVLGLMLAAPAMAWDAALLSDVRFSPDGRYFSFVEYGELTDTDGIAHAAMYVIDTERDAWVAGTPIRVHIEREGVEQDEALAQVRQEGRDLVASLALQDAARPIVPFLDVDRDDPYVRRRTVELPGRAPMALELVERAAQSAHFCTEDVPVGQDFSLFLTAPDHHIVMADFKSDLPRSRGCPTGYDIAAAYVHRAPHRTYLAVVIGVHTPGWEGEDRRLIALVQPLPSPLSARLAE